MKNIFTILSLIMILNINGLCSQLISNEEYFYSISGSLNKVCIVDEDLIYTVGDKGMFMESKDGGNSWKHIPLKISNPINDIKHIDNTIVLIFNNGEIVCSKDRGNSWQNNFKLNNNGLRALTLVSESKWIIAGDNAVHISYDGGESWTTKKINIQFSFQLFANNNVIIVTDRTNKILFSYDEGETWEKNEDLEVQSKNGRVKTIKKITNSSFVILLNNKYAISYNNGNSFTYQNLNQEYKDFYFQDMQFFGVKDRIGVQKEYIEIYKEDFVSNSTERLSLSIDTTFDIDLKTMYINDFAILNNRAIAVGAGKSILKSEDAGKSWEIISILSSGNIGFYNDFSTIVNNSKYIFVGAARSKIFRSSDEGATWLPQKNSKLAKDRIIHRIIIDENGEGIFYSWDINTLSPKFGRIHDNAEKLEYMDSTIEYYRSREDYIFKKKKDIYYQGLQDIANSSTRVLCMDNKGTIFKYFNTDSINIRELRIIDSLNIEGWGDEFKGVKPKISGDWYSYSSTVHFYTSDGGITWQKDTIDKKYEMKRITYCSSSDNQRMFLVCNNGARDSVDFTKYLDSYTEKVFESNDYGKTWDLISTHTAKPINNEQAFGMKDFFVYSGELYAFNDIGLLFIYDKSSQFWTFVNQGISGILKVSLIDSNFQISYLITYDKSIYKSNFPQDTTSVEEIEVSDDMRALLYSSEPYPIPATSKIQSRIYWNQIYQISDAKLSVYDIFGNKLFTPNVYIDASESYTGILTWECDNIDTGIYFIRVSLQNETINIPVTVYR